MDAIGRLVRDGVAVGTAFVVSEGGLAATAAHVIGHDAAATWAFEPLTAPGISLPVDTGLPRNMSADLALVQVSGADDWEPVMLASHTSAVPGDPVHLRGFAASRDYDSGIGTYVGETAEHGRVWVKASCQHAQPGMSGAPVLLTGTGCVIGIVSARVNADRWNRDTVLLARSEDLVALAPERLHLVMPTRRFANGILRLSWEVAGATTPILETDDFNVSIGRNSSNRVRLSADRDSRFHGHLALVGTALMYHHLSDKPAFLSGATRQLKVEKGQSSPIGDKDRLHFASGTMLMEFSAPDLYDPNARPTSDDDEQELSVGL